MLKDDSPYMRGYTKTPLGDGYTKYTEYGNEWYEDACGNEVFNCALCGKFVLEDDLNEENICKQCEADKEEEMNCITAKYLEGNTYSVIKGLFLGKEFTCRFYEKVNEVEPVDVEEFDADDVDLLCAWLEKQLVGE